MTGLPIDDDFEVYDNYSEVEQATPDQQILENIVDRYKQILEEELEL